MESSQNNILNLKFFADDNLGRLAKWLRILGFDTYFYKKIPKDEILNISKNEDRIILSRDHNLINKAQKLFIKNLLIKSPNFDEQIRQIIERFKIKKAENLFTRCAICNNLLQELPKEKAFGLIPSMSYEWRDIFYFCSGCGKIYWEGTHCERIKTLLNSLFE